MPWVKLAAVRQPTVTGILGDIDAHLPAGHIYKDSDKVTWAHETTHGINARIRNELRVQNGFYCLFNRAFTIDSPKITLKDISNNTPASLKQGKTYKLYIVQQQRYWNDTPLYVLDELTAYTNGAIVGIENQMWDRATYSLECAKEMLEFSKIALSLCPSNYSHTTELAKYIRWYSLGPLALAIRGVNKNTQ
jgi:hypothetical protein